MSELFNITIENGTSKRLPVGNKWSEKDIIVSAPPIPDEYIIPSGTKSITENGTHDVTEYASVEVDVATSGGGSGGENKLAQVADGTITEITAEDLQGATEIRNYAFNTAKVLTSVSLPSTVTRIGEYAFADSGIVNIEMDSVTSINRYAFYRCNNKNALSNLVLPPNLTYLGERAFQQCVMKTVVIPASISSLNGSYIFAYNTALTTVTVLRTTPPTLSSSTFNGCTALNQIIVPIGCGDAYKSATNWSAYADKIIEGDV